MKYDVLIIGAGAAGLMAMDELLRAGYRVALLEAHEAPGGRIATINAKGFEKPVETGAEFIHGKLPLTLQLLKKAGIRYEALAGKMIGVRKGNWDPNEQHEEHWDQLMKKLRRQEKDMTIHAFLEHHFPGPEYKELRQSARSFAEGFDLADTRKASVVSVRKEWQHEEQKQFRIPGGYGQLINWLLNNCLSQKGDIFFNCPAKLVEYNRETVTITTNKKKFQATRVIVTASIGVLKSGAIRFKPGLGVHGDAIKQLGFGHVIKFLLQFNNPFWKERSGGIGFLITDEPIPTWWTQLPEESSILTGWLGGPPAMRRSGDTKASLLEAALLSLSQIFQLPVTVLKKQLTQHRIVCWGNDPLALGGYSYNTLFSQKAIEILSEPIAGCVYFAGEAIHSGEAQGTVEAALQSGLAAAKKIRRAR
jgi:monoamine oxidase